LRSSSCGGRTRIPQESASPDGTTTTLAVLPPVGGAFDSDPVPNSVTFGPGGALYEGQLTGAPFPAGAASVYRLAPGRTLHPVRHGLHQHHRYCLRPRRSAVRPADLPTQPDPRRTRWIALRSLLRTDSARRHVIRSRWVNLRDEPRRSTGVGDMFCEFSPEADACGMRRS